MSSEEGVTVSDEQVVEVPQFIVNLIGRLVAENEALKAGLVPANPTVVVDDTTIEGEV